MPILRRSTDYGFAGRVRMAVVAVQLAYVGLWPKNRLGCRGLLVIGVMRAVNIPYYEEMAGCMTGGSTATASSSPIRPHIR